jgi:hypothetical protein
MDQPKQYRPEAYDKPVDRISDEAARELADAKTIRPIIDADRIKPMNPDFVSNESLLKLLDGGNKQESGPSDVMVSPGLKSRAKSEEKTIIDNWDPRKDNGEEQLKNGRKPVKDFYIDEMPVKR